MRTLAVFTVLFLAATGCDKSSSPAEKTAAKPVEAAAIAAVPQAASPTPVKTAAEGDSDSCAGGDMDCSGGCNQWDKEAAEVLKRDVPADASWTVISVKGMTCGGCERRIIANVGKLAGVVAVEADAELGQVRVATADDASKAKASAIARINELGYTVQ